MAVEHREGLKRNLAKGAAVVALTLPAIPIAGGLADRYFGQEFELNRAASAAVSKIVEPVPDNVLYDATEVSNTGMAKRLQEIRPTTSPVEISLPPDVLDANRVIRRAAKYNTELAEERRNNGATARHDRNQQLLAGGVGVYAFVGLGRFYGHIRTTRRDQRALVKSLE